MRLTRDESGFTVVELVIVMTLLGIVMAGLSSLFVSGLRTSNTTNAMLASQVQIHVALDRLELETRCASQATLLSSGGGVALALPSQCPHAAGTVSWCVTGGSLMAYTTSDCSGSGETLASNITSATPFSCLSTVGDYPELQVALTAQTQSTTDTVSATDTIAMRNAAVTTSTTSSCA